MIQNTLEMGHENNDSLSMIGAAASGTTFAAVGV